MYNVIGFKCCSVIIYGTFLSFLVPIELCCSIDTVVGLQYTNKLHSHKKNCNFQLIRPVMVEVILALEVDDSNPLNLHKGTLQGFCELYKMSTFVTDLTDHVLLCDIPSLCAC